MSDVSTAGHVTVTPATFTFVRYDADEIAAIVTELAERLGITNPIHVVVDETTPLAKLSERLDGTSADATITLHAESGALEDRQHPMSFSVDHARESLGRVLLRARDRQRPDFADTPDDLDLTIQENAAWDTYCAGRLARLGIAVNQQRWRYNHRNRFGFHDGIDAAFDTLWHADDLGWSDVLSVARGR
ncbi:MAG TPA: hypothetical protein VK853_11390 [Ilumatobacteraceae bacterium]|nr:hypothetical protein [Ilumatobacteraceae bacterium]